MKKLLILSLLLTIVLLSGCVDQEVPEKTEITTTIAATTTVQTTELNLKVGETAKTSKVQVTVMTAEKKDYYEYYSDVLKEYMTEEASPGKAFILVDVEIKNIGSDRVFVGSSEFSMTDSEGYRYDPQLYFGDDGLEMFKELYQDQKMRGKVLFEVPEDATGLKMQYDFGNLLIGVKLATWEIS